METLIILLLILVCFKWLTLSFLFPWICLLFHFKKDEKPIKKVFAWPGIALEKFSHEGVSRLLIINIGHIPSVNARKYLYQWLGVKMGERVVVHYDAEIRAPYRLTLGTGTIIGDHAILDARNRLRIGNHVNLASNVSIYTEQHDYNDTLFRCTDRKEKSVTIGDRVWIGSNVVVLPGVKIGEGAVCCAGCVVTKDVAPFEVVAGIPAKKIAERTHDLKYEFDGSSCWFY